MDMKSKILCLDDDLTTQALVEAILKNFQIISALTIKEAEVLLKKHQFVSLLVDIHLPDGDGIRFVSEFIEKELKDIPIFIFSNYKEIANKVMAFSIGADDFIEKPFDPIELKARVESRILKKNKNKEQNQNINIGDVIIDLDRQKALHINKAEEIDLQLTSHELKILKLLGTRPEQVYSREQILEKIWSDTYISDRTIDSHISHLRHKIENTKISLNTIKNFGYSLKIKT